jgi:acetyl esterase/lipase/predicted N-formylglutamate amidohydrolase
VLAGYSRLFVDCNRHTDLESHIPTCSDGISIHGNIDLTDQERALRTRIAHDPYHAAVDGLVNLAWLRSQKPVLVAIHSFTPVLQQYLRPWQVGVLWKHRDRLSQSLLANLRADARLLDGSIATVGDNEPYSGQDYLGFTLERHMRSEHASGVCIEVRNDQLLNPILIEHWAAILANAIELAVSASDLDGDQIPNAQPSERDFHDIDHKRRQLECSLACYVPSEARSNIECERVLGGVPCLQLSGGSAHDDASGFVLYVHGGCFVYGSAHSTLATLWSVGQHVGSKLISIDYRLAPEHPYPAGRDDVIRVYRALLCEGVAASQICLLGDSAGANLVLSALLKLRDDGTPTPTAIALISPWVDLALRGDTVQTLANVDSELTAGDLRVYAQAYAGAQALDASQLSPLHANLGLLPPLLIQVGTREILLSDSVRLARAARRQGAEVTLDVWDEMRHVFHLDSDLPQSREAGADIAIFFRHHLQKHPVDRTPS